MQVGTPLCHLGAIKMELVVRAQRDGVVKGLLANLKASVQGGELLAVIA